MSTKPQELKKVIDNLRQIIVGKVAMPPDQIEQITLFLFLKQLSKKHDALVRAKSKELIFTGEYERYHFDVLIRHSGEELVKECREAVESLYKNPNIDATVRRVFEKSYLKILDPKVLAAFLSYLNEQFSDGMDLGDFYESLLPILGTQNELGQFRTPRHIINFIVRAVDPSIGEKICDPACGTAGFLVAAFNYLKEKYTDKSGRLALNPEQTKKLYNETIFGWDMEPLMVKFSLANLYLHGLKNPNVSENDTLLNENLWQHTLDVIMANPPFITPRGGARRHSRFAVTSNKTEVLFCEWMVHHLNFNGRLGMIVPEGIIFDRSRGHQAIRKLFLDSGLWCVVSLPSAVFQPYSGVKTSIVFVDKSLKPKEILFVNIKNHGFSLNTNPAPIESNDLPAALEIIKKYRAALKENKSFELGEAEKELAHLVAKEKIEASGDFNLTGERYKKTEAIEHQKWPPVELGEIIDLNFGTRITKRENKGTLYPVYGGGGESFRTDAYNRENELIISRFAMSENCVRFVSGKFFLLDSGFTFSIKPDKTEQVLKNFVDKFLLSIQARIYNSTKQFAQKNLDVAQFKQIKIPLPPIEVQKEIVEQIEVKQNAINHAKEIIKNLERERRYFGKEIRKLDDVKWVELGEVCEINPKKSQVSKLPAKTEVSFVPMADVLENSMQFDAKQIKNLSGVSGSYTYFADNDVLLAKVTPCFENGKAGIARRLKNGIGFGSSEFIVLRASKRILPEIVYGVISSDDFREAGKSRMSGTGGLQRVPPEFVRKFKIPLPPLEIQKQLAAEAEREEEIIAANRQLIETMERKIADVLSEI